MFDIGFTELILVSIIGLLVLGPERLPGAIKTISLWLGKLRSSFNSVRAEIERELHADEIKRELHNQAILQNLKQAGEEVKNSLETPYEIGDIGRAGSEQQATDADKPAAADDIEQR